jgi:hypothetical protein
MCWKVSLSPLGRMAWKCVGRVRMSGPNQAQIKPEIIGTDALVIYALGVVKINGSPHHTAKSRISAFERRSRRAATFRKRYRRSGTIRVIDLQIQMRPSAQTHSSFGTQFLTFAHEVHRILL